MAVNVRTCSFCGKLFQSLGMPNCPQCSLKLDEDFIKVREYLYSNPKSAVHATEIAEETGISEKAVLYFLKEGKLARKEPEKIDLTCARCGVAIASGKLCAKCVSRWNSEVDAIAKSADKPDTRPGEKPRDKTEKSQGTRMHTRQDQGR